MMQAAVGGMKGEAPRAPVARFTFPSSDDEEGGEGDAAGAMTSTTTYTSKAEGSIGKLPNLQGGSRRAKFETWARGAQVWAKLNGCGDLLDSRSYNQKLPGV